MVYGTASVSYRLGTPTVTWLVRYLTRRRLTGGDTIKQLDPSLRQVQIVSTNKMSILFNIRWLNFPKVQTSISSLWSSIGCVGLCVSEGAFKCPVSTNLNYCEYNVLFNLFCTIPKYTALSIGLNYLYCMLDLLFVKRRYNKKLLFFVLIVWIHPS